MNDTITYDSAARRYDEARQTMERKLQILSRALIEHRKRAQLYKENDDPEGLDQWAHELELASKRISQALGRVYC